MLAAADSTQLATFDLLDEAECEDWVLRTLLLRRHWRRRHAEAPFFTLGLAAYLDCSAGSAYHDVALRSRNNRMLESHFGPLLQALATRLGDHFGAPASMTDGAAWPGFHIYLPHPAFSLPVASVHRDLQYRDVFPGQAIGEDDMFSFTLPLSTPEGSGLNIWSAGAAAAAPDFHPYRSGQLVVHSGLATHQAVLRCDGDLERITLQGHGVRLGQRILLYW
ncbi:hypothetical protein CFter6_2518 [Collimonas fungivorans]|uniref:Uncharacterized protein n=1 Tax=Collimonas fungivorans TaxID=158899 RepID=A0A127PBJ7_9BURK|nr:hypothetical protein CFter6_2518 [Collimonas fungivorans]